MHLVIFVVDMHKRLWIMPSRETAITEVYLLYIFMCIFMLQSHTLLITVLHLFILYFCFADMYR